MISYEFYDQLELPGRYIVTAVEILTFTTFCPSALFGRACPKKTKPALKKAGVNTHSTKKK